MLAIIIISFFAILILFAGIFKVNGIVNLLAVNGIVLSALSLIFLDDNAVKISMTMFSCVNEAKFFSLLILLVVLLILMLAPFFLKEDEKYKADKVALLLFSTCGAILMLSAKHMVLLFLGIEILSIPLYILAASDKNDLKSNEAGMKYFLMGSFTTGILLFGMALLYGSTGTLLLDPMGIVISSSPTSNPMLIAGMLLLIAGFGFKLGLVPFHFWSPDVYEGSPTLYTAFMATIVKIAGFGAFAKLLFTTFSSIHASWMPILACITAATLILANVTALHQNNFKRLLAYSSISNAGYIMLGILAFQITSFHSIGIYLLTYSLASLIAFAVFMVINKQTGGSDIESFRGLGSLNPLHATLLTIGILSMAGIPITGGFIAKYMLFSSAYSSYSWLVVIAVLSSAVSIYYYFKPLQAIWFKEQDSTVEKLRFPIAFTLVLAICSLLILFIGIYPQVLIGI